jgi:transposase
MAKAQKPGNIKRSTTLDQAVQRALLAEAALANQIAINAEKAATIAKLEWELAQMRRQLYGPRKERSRQLIDQLALGFEDAQANAAEAEAVAEEASARAKVAAHERKRPARKPFPEHLPRERVELAPPEACGCCGSNQLSRIGEDVTETLEVIPRQWKVIQTVRPKMACRACEAIGQQPAPFHVTPRGWAGPNFLAMLLFEKYGTHQPLNRQRDRYAREGVDLSLSTLADQVGHAAAILRPLHELIKGQVLSAGRVHADDTTVPVLARHQTITGRIWTYVRDDKPFGGSDPPAAWYCYSPDRTGEHPRAHLASYCGILQSDAYSGYNGFFAGDREAGPMTNGLCWAHARRKFFELAVLKPKRGKQSPPPSPLAREAVTRIDALFDIEREINTLSAEQRLARRSKDSKPLLISLKT